MKCVVLFKKDVVWFCLKRKLRGKIIRCGGENSVRETVCRGKFWATKREKDDVYRAVRTINAMESLKVMPVRYEQFLVANM